MQNISIYPSLNQLSHSCAPTVRPSFPKGTSELHLVANRDIKAGEELTMSYVRATPTEGEIPLDNRKMRRQELARGWRFACECTKCSEEATEMEKNKADAADSAENGDAKGKVEEKLAEEVAASA